MKMRAPSRRARLTYSSRAFLASQRRLLLVRGMGNRAVLRYDARIHGRRVAIMFIRNEQGSVGIHYIWP